MRMEAALAQVMRSSRPRPAQLLRSELLMEECFHETDESCTLHQLSAKTQIDYGTLFDAFQKLHWEFYKEGELIAVSPRLLITWCERRRQSVYFLDGTTLVYKSR